MGRNKVVWCDLQYKGLSQGHTTSCTLHKYDTSYIQRIETAASTVHHIYNNVILNTTLVFNKITLHALMKAITLA
jgi:hypothetical protein